jgi:hypothetical protein
VNRSDACTCRRRSSSAAAQAPAACWKRPPRSVRRSSAAPDSPAGSIGPCLDCREPACSSAPTAARTSRCSLLRPSRARDSQDRPRSARASRQPAFQARKPDTSETRSRCAARSRLRSRAVPTGFRSRRVARRHTSSGSRCPAAELAGPTQLLRRRARARDGAGHERWRAARLLRALRSRSQRQRCTQAPQRQMPSLRGHGCAGAR